VLNLKKINIELESSRKKLRDEFFANPEGKDAALKQTVLTDNLLKNIFSNYVSNERFSDLVLCAAGGYGRRELAPYSDIDLIFFTEKKITNAKIKNSVKKILYTLWDLNFKVGYSIRNLYQEINIDNLDNTSATNMLDARYLAGNYTIYKKFKKKLMIFFKKKKNFINTKVEEKKLRLLERNTDSQILEPDIKFSRGGLRDINLIFWALKIKYLTSNPDELLESKVITKFEFRKIKSLFSFIFTVRFFLHYLSDRPNDKLTFEYQKKISQLMKYKSRKKTLGVERFMKHYHLQVRFSIYLNYIILEQNEKISSPFFKLSNFFIPDLKSKFFSNGKFLHLNKKNKLEQNPSLIMEFFLECQKRKLLPGYGELRTIINTIGFINKSQFDKKFIKDTFVFILINDSNNLLVEVLNETGLLAKIVPYFSKILALSQFDQYHIYSVDYHLIKALKNLKQIDYVEKKTKNNYLFDICSSIQNKLPLYFSVLLHDIGKGSSANHTIEGFKISKQISKFFDFSDKECEDISWLVKNHLEFCNTAFKKDTEDPKIIIKLCKEIKNHQRLLKLFLISVVDLQSVNNSVWNEWKESLLRKLFYKCEDYFLNPKISNSSKRYLLSKKTRIQELLVLTNPTTLKNFNKISCDEYWLMQDSKNIAFQIDRFFSNKIFFNKNNFHLRKDKVFGFFELIIITKNRNKLLIDIVKSIIASEMKIMDAKIFTFKNNMVTDIFKITPLKNLQNLSKADLSIYEKKLRHNLKIFFRNQSVHEFDRVEEKVFLKKSIDIRFDNQNKEYTVLEIRTNDRQLLLLDILEALSNFEADVLSAKISTFGEMVEDIFHLKKNNSRISNSRNLLRLRTMIEKNIIKSRDKVVN